MKTITQTIKIPQALVEDAGGFDLINFVADDLRRQLESPSARPKPAPARGTMEWTTALANAVGDGEGLVDPGLRVELIESVLEGLEGADTEGLGAPYEEEAAGTVDWILGQLEEAGELRRTPA